MNKRYVIGAIVAAIVVVGVLIGLSVAGGDDEAAAGPVTGAAEVAAKFEGVPQRGNTIGDPSAAINVVEYGDTSCPVCKDAAETSVADLIERHVKTGEITLTFRPVAFISPSSERGALGAEAAAKQDAMWPLVDLIYINQGDEADDWLTDARLEELVSAAGLDLAQWREDYASEEVASTFFDNDAAWRADGGNGTPHFVVTGPRGEQVLDGAVGISAFEEAFAAVGPAS